MTTMRTIHSRKDEEGAITIIVVLMLLVLLMVAAFGMSRDSLRELRITSSSRQGSELFNESDTGINWAVFWMNANTNRLGTTSVGSKALADQMDKQSDNFDLTGLTFNIPATGEMISTPAPNKTAQFNIDLTQMGQLLAPGISQNISNAAVAPLIWAVRSNASVTYAGSATFLHSREAWITTPRGPSNQTVKP